MSSVYATIDDIAVYGRKLTSQEQQAADSLIETACAKLRVIGKRYGVDVNALVTSDEDYALTVKAIISKAVVRSLDCSADNAPPAVQASQAAMRDTVILDDVISCKLNSDYNYTDEETKRYRYQAVFDIRYYEKER